MKKTLFVLTLSLLLFSCRKKKDVPAPPPDVYVSGYYETSNLDRKACYWKNGTRMELHPAGEVLTESISHGMTQAGGDIYICGFIEQNGKKRACYWKNGAVQFLTDGTNNAEASSIAVNGTDVYAAGYETTSTGKYVAKYWKNGQAVTLNGSLADEFRVESIAVSGSTVYTLVYNLTTFRGISLFANSTSLFAYPITSSNDAITDIAVQGSDVFTIGRIGNEPVYYKNNTKIIIRPAIPNSAAYGGIVFNGTDFYIGGIIPAGVSNIAAVYWKNGNQLFQVGNPADEPPASNSRAVAFHEGTLYVAGTKRRPADAGRQQSRAVYWKNGEEKELSDGTANNYVTGIAVK